ncbi:MAG: sulfur carrier protein ThiS [Xanthobacteraceae bacterium]
MGMIQAMIRINGEGAPLTAATLAELLAEKGVADGKGVAVALNGQVVRRHAWSDTKLSPGDDVEIVRVRQGG